METELTFSKLAPYGSRFARRGLLTGCACALLVVSACKRGSATAPGGQPKGEQKARAVRVVQVAARPLERNITVLGSLAALDQAVLSTKIAGRLEHVGVDLGSMVRKGDLIAQIEPRDYELRLKQAEGQLAQTRARLGLPLQGGRDEVEVDNTSAVKAAKAVLNEATKHRDRVTSLVKQGVTPASELETAQAGYEVAANRHDTTVEEMRSLIAQLAQRRTEVEIARQQLTDTAMHAPFDGAIQERKASRGEYLSVSAPVVTLVRVDPLRLRLEVPEREAANVKSGQGVRLTIEGDTNVYAGSITRLSPAIIEQNRMLIVEADVPSRGVLRPGLFARAEIVTSTNDAGLVIPRNALVSFAGLEKVFAVKDGKATEKLVATGRGGVDWVELIKGAKAGEEVVIQPGNLQSGATVTITTADAPKKGSPSGKGQKKVESGGSN